MSDRTRSRINAAFDDEFSDTPVPPSLRALSIRSAITAPRRRSHQAELLALVAVVLVVAIAATVFLATHVTRNAPTPAGTTIPPAPIANAASAFDQAHGELVIFGGNTGTNPPTNETWTWDGKYWRHMHSATSPSARSLALMAYDPAHGNAVLFGGQVVDRTGRNGGCCSTTVFDDTWTWNGTTWRQMHPQHQPLVGTAPESSIAYDPVTKSVLLFGFSQTTTGSKTDRQAQLWSWNGSDWRQINWSPPPTVSGPLVSDDSHLLLLEPGQFGGRYVTQTWEWGGDNLGWAVLKPSANLPELGNGFGAYDPGRKQLVLLTSDTWTWDGSKWTRQHPTLQPQAPGYMAYVPSLHEVVSWGDRTASVDNEMFGWDGSDWKVIEPGTTVWPVSNGKGGFNATMTPDQAAATVRATVKNTHPVLLPTVLPNGSYDARVWATADDFNIQYQSDQRDKTITFGILVANPPPSAANPSDTRVRFRNAVALKYGANGYAEYFVYDPTDPTSQRWLAWNEPGTAANPMYAGGGVPYFLSASGLTDQEFWQIANSLQ